MKNNEPILGVNKLKNRYVTDGNIWTVDETIFNNEVFVFLVINIKTKAILGYVLGQKNISGYYMAELYKLILDNYPLKDQSPLIVHSDSENEYFTSHIIELFKEENIQVSVSVSVADKHQNQVSEAVNNQIKFSTVCNIIEEGQNTKEFRNLVRIQPDKFKHKSKVSKAQSKEYRQWLFKSEYFRNRAFKAIEKAILDYNERNFSRGITRKEAEYYNTWTYPLPLDMEIFCAD